MVGAILGFLLLIIKVILWLLLAAIGVVLLLVMMVLFVPIRYDIEGSKYEAIKGKIKVTYLFRLLRVFVEYDSHGMVVFVKVLFFTVYRQPENDKPKKSVNKRVKTKRIRKQDGRSSEVNEENTTKIHEEMLKQSVASSDTESKRSEPGEETLVKGNLELPTTSDELRQASQQPKSVAVHVEKKPNLAPMNKKNEEKITKSDKNIAKTTEKKSKEKKPGEKKPLKKEKKEGESGLDKAKRFYGFLREERNVGVLRFVVKRIFKAIGSVLPRRFRAKIHFGLDDPALTGYILGAISVFYVKYKDSMVVTADFEAPVLEGEVRIKGRILPVVFLWMVIRLLLDGRVRRLIKEARK